VLLVLRADAAVQRAARIDVGLQRERERARLVEPLLRQIQLGVGVDQRLELAVLGAALAHQHPVLPHVHLGVDHPFAHGADRPRELQEHLVAVHVGYSSEYTTSAGSTSSRRPL
jgi:hypothetical protein